MPVEGQSYWQTLVQKALIELKEVLDNNCTSRETRTARFPSMYVFNVD
jgi:hypothetical protein